MVYYEKTRLKHRVNSSNGVSRILHGSTYSKGFQNNIYLVSAVAVAVSGLKYKIYHYFQATLPLYLVSIWININ